MVNVWQIKHGGIRQEKEAPSLTLLWNNYRIYLFNLIIY